MVVSFCLLNLSYQNALSALLEQFWESRLIFISLSMFDLWIIIVDLGLFTRVVSLSAVCLRNLHCIVLQTVLSTGAFLYPTPILPFKPRELLLDQNL